MTTIIKIILIVFIINPSYTYEIETNTQRNLEFCKVSHLGLEYQGFQAKTESGVRCQLWQTQNPVHKVNEKYTDDNFPENSKKRAKNYCRNPSGDQTGPWCYTMDPNLINETCAIPLCMYTDCKITGPGIEYGGIHNYGTSERKCLKWDKSRNRVKNRNKFVKIEKFTKDKFPDETVSDAKKYCRNPDGDIGGPWCFIENQDTDEIEREYCDIPFCDIHESLIFSKNDTVYSHYNSFDSTATNFTFGVKIWDSDSHSIASARLVLSLFALPLTRQQLRDSETGIEIFISNRNSALTVGSKDKVEYEPTTNTLKSTDFTFFSLTWSSGFITLNKEGNIKPIFINEFKAKKNLLGFLKDHFNFYAFQGVNILWNFPFTNTETFCTVHTTTSLMFQQFLPLRETNIGYNLQVFVRATHSAHILLVSSPSINFPYIEIMLRRLDNFTRIVGVEYENGSKIILKEIALPLILNYWTFNEFSISLFADTLQIYWSKDIGKHMIVESKHELLRKMRWFSPSSDDNVAHWTFYCKPPLFAYAPNAWPPECALNKYEPDYKGTQFVTNEGLPCVPWSSKKLLPELAHGLLSKNESLEAQNYCRNPNNNAAGTFCYAVKQSPNVTIVKKYCYIRPCKSAECRIAGTGNDYVGKVYKTRSGLICKNWLTSLKNHSLYSFLNDTYFPDMSVEAAENFCRNPTRSVVGSWCITTDSNITKDVCNVRDCDKVEECTVVVQGLDKDQYVYILPEWKESGLYGGLYFSLKQWDPDISEGLVIEIKSINSSESITLILGAGFNEKITLYYGYSLIKEKIFPHLVPSGKWISFWLQIRKGEILLGFQGVPDPFFEWKHSDLSNAFEPVFLSYTSLNGFSIGVSFKCGSCHSEVTSASHSAKIRSVGLWSEEEQILYNNLTLNVRGSGITLIQFYNFPDSGDFYELILDNIQNQMSLWKKDRYTFEDLYTVHTTALYNISSWTKFIIFFSENYMNVTMNETLVLKYENKLPLLIYWFSVSAKNGTITWTANCDHPDIDGKPVDGGWSHWSPWQCTVSCGGGEGYRTRTCSNPTPNIFGKLCEGSPTSTGICNDFECGDISPETIDKIRNNLQTQHFSFIVNELDNVVIENDHDVIDIISMHSPEAYYEWTLNGLPVESDVNHRKFENDNIFINNVEISDMGVYVCMLYRINKQKLIFRIVSVAVLTSSYVISTRATLDLTLKSNAVILGYIYSDLRQKWLLNNTIYIDYGITTLAGVSTEVITSLNLSHTGIWKCAVEQSDLQLRWITNILKLEVKSAPNIYSHLREDSLTAPLFSWLKSDKQVLTAIISIVFFVCLLVVICLFMYIKWGTLPTAKQPRRNRPNKK